ncbi:MAG: DUF4870 domain-containing protein [Candidatus Obscuribacterales bacterium]|jgi:uncharacterized Tic20 family protein|nr:DUF4870 domain-containing protein [Candidatus Obscuribacterales bacterium]
MQKSTTIKVLRASCHASALVSWSVVSIGLPIAVLLLNDDPFVKDSAKEAINFQITMIILTAIAGALFVSVLGIPLALLMFAYIGIASLIFPIIAIVSVCADPEKTYRYPLTVRLIKPSMPDRIATTSL